MSQADLTCKVCKRDMIEICHSTGMRIKYAPIDDTYLAKFTINSDGKKQGCYDVIHRTTGVIRLALKFNNGLPHGHLAVWREDGGGQCLQGNYSHGKRHGQWMLFEEDPFMGYAIVLYHNNNLIEYSKYNYQQECVEYENYNDNFSIEYSNELTIAICELFEHLVAL